MGPAWHPSPNFGPRRKGARPDLVVLHHTAMKSCAAARDRLCCPEAEVSAHYLISETGDVIQMVEEVQRAWHAGTGRWGAVDDVNSRSIGIELANTGAHPYPAPQMAALEILLGDILDRHAIPPERVIAHSDMAPDRKNDPGPRFDWARLARADLSVWPAPQGAVTGTFEAHARTFGYTAETEPDSLLAAFRLRFRPGKAGPQDDVDLALIADLAKRFPVRED
ncbi:N-acetylmuramoyl-L-alanine amidase [Roseovarius aestuariivivens]|uniref:N-acetylmuramoyl-L-alanine amidase n=1 Tax=Roseovarius aestuariivivens TaxID=1888910 RepID=UPI00108047B2|nr:N-acetylmuramoyl-L-alanine amidase [Roseovarius aestuariivivens]